MVSELALLEDGGLIAWVEGTHSYATKVTVDEEGFLESTCTCPYGCDCKHGVAVVLEYLEQKKKKKRISKAAKEDERIFLLKEEEWEEEPDDEEEDEERDASSLSKTEKSEIAAYLQGKTKDQLTELILELAI